MGLANSLDDCSSIQPQSESIEDGNGEIDLTGIDDDEIDSYIMSEREAQYKDSLWMKINATFLKEQKGILLPRTVMTTLHHKLINSGFHCFTMHFGSLSFIYTKLMHFFIQTCISLLSYIKIT